MDPCLDGKNIPEYIWDGLGAVLDFFIGLEDLEMNVEMLRKLPKALIAEEVIFP